MNSDGRKVEMDLMQEAYTRHGIEREESDERDD